MHSRYTKQSPYVNVSIGAGGEDFDEGFLIRTHALFTKSQY